MAIFEDGTKLVVNYQDDQPHGEGTIYFPDGSVNKAVFDKGKVKLNND